MQRGGEHFTPEPSLLPKSFHVCIMQQQARVSQTYIYGCLRSDMQMWTHFTSLQHCSLIHISHPSCRYLRDHLLLMVPPLTALKTCYSLNRGIYGSVWCMCCTLEVTAAVEPFVLVHFWSIYTTSGLTSVNYQWTEQNFAELCTDVKETFTNITFLSNKEWFRF